MEASSVLTKTFLRVTFDPTLRGLLCPSRRRWCLQEVVNLRIFSDLVASYLHRGCLRYPDSSPGDLEKGEPISACWDLIPFGYVFSEDWVQASEDGEVEGNPDGADGALAVWHVDPPTLGWRDEQVDLEGISQSDVLLLDWARDEGGSSDIERDIGCGEDEGVDGSDASSMLHGCVGVRDGRGCRSARRRRRNRGSDQCRVRASRRLRALSPEAACADMGSCSRRGRGRRSRASVLSDGVADLPSTATKHSRDELIDKVIEVADLMGLSCRGEVGEMRSRIAEVLDGEASLV